MGMPDHLTCLPRNLYTGQEATVRTRHGTMDWFKIGKEVHQGYILSSCLYAEYIMWIARLDEAQVAIRIAGRNINNLRYTDDTTLVAESEEKLKSLMMRVKEESKTAGLKFNTSYLETAFAGRWLDFQMEVDYSFLKYMYFSSSSLSILSFWRTSFCFYWFSPLFSILFC